MKHTLLFLLIVCTIINTAQAMNPSRKRAREVQPQTLSAAQVFNQKEREIVQKIWLEEADTKSCLSNRLLFCEIVWQQAVLPEFGFSEQERKLLEGHIAWLRTLQKIHFPESIAAILAQPEDKNESNVIPEQPTSSKRHCGGSDLSDSL